MHVAEATTVRDFIKASCNLPELEDDCDIFETRIANSLFVIELMMFIESEFAVKVTTDDLDLENFNSVKAIERFLELKRA
jgi:acyl carrier protein